MRFSHKVKKKLNIAVEIETTSAKIFAHKEKISQKSNVEVSFETVVPEPTVFNPITPTNKNTQEIRGFRPSEDFIVEINESPIGIVYNKNEFKKRVHLHDGKNRFQIRLKKKHDYSKAVSISIEKNTIPPITNIFVNNRLASSNMITNRSYDISFEVSSQTEPSTTFYQINNQNIRVFSNPFLLTDEGEYQIEFWSKDSLDNEEIPHDFLVLEIKKTPPERPEISISDLPAKTNASFIRVHGTNSLDTEILDVNGVRATRQDATHWFATIPLLIEGVNIITAVAFDAAGNESAPATVSIVRKQIPPARPKIITQTRRTKNNTLRVIGSQSDDTVSMVLNGGFPIKLTSFIRWATDLVLEEGPNNFIVHAIDDVGNVSLPLEFTIVRKSIPPPVPTIDPVISPTNIVSQLLTGTSKFSQEVVMNNTIRIPVSNDEWKIIINLETEGLNEIKVQAADDLDNRSDPVFAEIVLKTTPPAAPTIDPIPLFTNIGSLFLSGTKSLDSSAIMVNDDSTEVSFPSSTTWNKTADLVVGRNQFSVRAIDIVGNISPEATAATEYKVAPPTFSIDNFSPKTLGISALIRGTREISSLIHVNNGTISYPDGHMDGTMWVCSSFLDIGINNLIFRAKDLAGNISAPQSINIERLLPVALSAFTITTVYGLGKEGKVFVNQEPAPILISKNIRSIFIEGRKPKGAMVNSNFGKIELPGGISGQSWQMILPVPLLQGKVLELTLEGDRVIDPPQIFVSDIVIAKNKFVGTISVKIGGTTDVTMEQDSFIILTDYQLKHTVSPIKGVPLGQILSIDSLVP